ncbi:MAG: hypothetical protein KDA65_19645, partial [Planctomycetaceae bacterium]|nr:hypothetical protein [Planctomycetaceae bacterium]
FRSDEVSSLQKWEPSRENLDDRWLDLAIEKNDLALVMALARSNHKPTQKFLKKTFDEVIVKSDWNWYGLHIVSTMFEIDSPDATACLMKVLPKFQKNDVSVNWWFEQILPKAGLETAEAIEAIIPKLSEHTVDALVPYLSDMKART